MDDAEDQDARQQEELNQEKRPDRPWTASIGDLGDQPDGSDRDHEDGNREDLGCVRRSAAHQEGRLRKVLQQLRAVGEDAARLAWRKISS